LPERPEISEYQRPAGNLLELLDRILDKGVVIIGDVKISVADIELLKIQIRLLIASVDKAKELGVDFSWTRGITSTPARVLPKQRQRRKRARSS
jgi:Gas vesicle protein